MWPNPQNIALVPVDFSADSLRAVDVALSIVDDPKCLHVIHVVRTENAGDPWLPQRDDALSSLHEYLSDGRYSDIQRTVACGDPGQEIVKFAKGIDAELIVIPSHGRTGLTRLLLGSVAERVVRLADCPVLVLRQ